MLANLVIKRRDGYRDDKDIVRIKMHFRNCKRDITYCARHAQDINVSYSDLQYPEVIRALHLIGFELGETYRDDRPDKIGYARRHRQYLIPT